MQNIKRVRKGLFNVSLGLGRTLQLDFRPLIEIANTEKPFILEHWQAPTQLWGYYQSRNDSYISTVWDKVLFSDDIRCSNIQVEKANANHRPTACKIYYNSMLMVDSEQIIILKLPD